MDGARTVRAMAAAALYGGTTRCQTGITRPSTAVTRQNVIASSSCSRLNGLRRQQVAPRSTAVRKKSGPVAPLPAP